jgi:hypothetical protein
MYMLEECERLQGIEKEAEDSTHNNRQVRKVQVKKKVKKKKKNLKKELKQNGGRL